MLYALLLLINPTDSLKELARRGEYQQLVAYCEQLRSDPESEASSTQLYYHLALGYQVIDVNEGRTFLDSARMFAEDSSFKSKIDILDFSLRRRSGDISKALKFGLKVKDRLPKTDTSSRIKVLRNIAICHRKLNDYDSAMYYILSAERLVNSYDDLYAKYRVINTKATILDYLGELEQCLVLEREMVDLTNALGNRSLQLTAMINIGASFSGLNQLDSCLYFYQKAEKLAEQLQEIYSLTLVKANLSGVYYRMGSVDRAIMMANEAIANANSLDRKDISVNTVVRLGGWLIEQNRVDEAISLTVKGLEWGSDLGNLRDEVNMHQILFEAYRIKGQYNKSIDHLVWAQKRSDSILNLDRLKYIGELQTRFETEKKEQEIRFLAQQNEIKDLQISQQRIILISSVSVFLLLGGFGYYGFRQRKMRANQRQLTLEQSLLRAQMNPHFIFNALNSIQSFITSNKNDEATMYLAKFGELTRDILEASRENWIPLSKELQMIRNYLDLEQARFQKELGFETSFDIADQEYLMVPPMMFQPFLENAIKHGFAEKAEGKIHLSLQQDGDQVRVQILDNGTGLTDSESHYQSRAIEITNQRLANLSDNKFSEVEILNQEKEGQISGVMVKFNFPLHYAI